MTIFDGVIPPIVTPFNDDYSINEDVLRSLVERLIVEGVHAIITTGSSGEFTRLSMEERKRVLEVTIDQAQGRIPVIAGTAASGTLEAIELSTHAESIGAAVLQIVAPFYASLSEDEIYDHYRRIGERVSIPVLMYNNRGLTSIDMSPDLIARLAEIPNVYGIKEATGDSRRMRQIISLAGDRITVFAGVDDNVLEAYELGVWGMGGRRGKPDPQTLPGVPRGGRGTGRLRGGQKALLPDVRPVRQDRDRNPRSKSQVRPRSPGGQRRTATPSSVAHRPGGP